MPIYATHNPSGGRSHSKGAYTDLSNKPRYPFGYELRYTTFELKHLRLDMAKFGRVGWRKSAQT